MAEETSVRFNSVKELFKNYSESLKLLPSWYGSVVRFQSVDSTGCLRFFAVESVFLLRVEKKNGKTLETIFATHTPPSPQMRAKERESRDDSEYFEHVYVYEVYFCELFFC